MLTRIMEIFCGWGAFQHLCELQVGVDKVLSGKIAVRVSEPCRSAM